MCWVMRKMKNALPKNAGTHSGFSVLYQCSDFQMMKPGIIVTWLGSIIVASKRRNAIDLPGQFSRANAYATKLDENSEPTVTSTTSNSELVMYRQNGTLLNALS